MRLTSYFRQELQADGKKGFLSTWPIGLQSKRREPLKSEILETLVSADVEANSTELSFFSIPADEVNKAFAGNAPKGVLIVGAGGGENKYPPVDAPEGTLAVAKNGAGVEVNRYSPLDTSKGAREVTGIGGEARNLSVDVPKGTLALTKNGEGVEVNKNPPVDAPRRAPLAIGTGDDVASHVVLTDVSSSTGLSEKT